MATLNELNKKIDQANLHLGDYEASKRKLTEENADLMKDLQLMEADANLLIKQKIAMVAALDEAKAIADNAAKDRISLLSKYRNLEHESDGLKEHLDEEMCDRDNIIRTVKKTQE